MAHTFDAFAEDSGTAGPETCSFTTGAGATVLVVSVITAGNIARAGGAPTFDGDAFTQIENTLDLTTTFVELWYLLDPSIGNFNIIVPNTTWKSIFIDASSYISATGESAFDVSAKDTDSTANPAVSVTTTEDGDVITDTMVSHGWYIPTGNSHTLLDSDGVAFSYWRNQQYALQANAGNITLSWTTGAADWGMIVAAFKEVSAGPLGHPWYYIPRTQ